MIVIFHNRNREGSEKSAKENTFEKRLISSVLFILGCAACMGMTAYAMFSHSVSTRSDLISSAKFLPQSSMSQVVESAQQNDKNSPPLTYAVKSTAEKNQRLQEIEKAEHDTQDTKTKSRWEINEPGTYQLNISQTDETGQASTGFCLITVTDEDVNGEPRTRCFHSSQIEDGKNEDFELTIKVLSPGAVAVESSWGRYENYGFPENNQALASGDTVIVGFKHASFVFDGNEASTVTVGDRVYVQPAASETVKKISDQDVKVKTVAMGFSDGERVHDAPFTASFPVFNGVLSIQDYQDAGTGDAVVFNGSSNELPKGLTIDQIEVVAPQDPVLQYYEANEVFAKQPKAVDGKLVYQTSEIDTYCDAYQVDVTYRYEDFAGGVFYYVIRYEAPAQTLSRRTVFVPGTVLSVSESNEKGEKVLVNKTIEEIKAGDVVQTYDFSGAVSENKVLLLQMRSKEEVERRKIQLNQYLLTFEDNRTLSVIGHQNFYDMTAREWVELNGNSWNGFIDRQLMVLNAEGQVVALKVVKVDVSAVVSDSYELVTAGNLNVFANQVLVCNPSPFLLPIFNVNENHVIDQDALNKLVEENGVFSYYTPPAEGEEEKKSVDETEKAISEVITKDTFEALRGQYFKIALNKNLITKAQLLRELAFLQNAINESQNQTQ